MTSPARQNFSTNRPRLRCLSDEHVIVALGLAARAKRRCLNICNDIGACGTDEGGPARRHDQSVTWSSRFEQTWSISGGRRGAVGRESAMVQPAAENLLVFLRRIAPDREPDQPATGGGTAEFKVIGTFRKPSLPNSCPRRGHRGGSGPPLHKSGGWAERGRWHGIEHGPCLPTRQGGRRF